MVNYMYKLKKNGFRETVELLTFHSALPAEQTDAFFKHYYHNQWLDHTHFEDELVTEMVRKDGKVVAVKGNEYNRKGHLVYTGQYENGVFNGPGRKYDAERNYYEGNFEDGKKSGNFVYHTERYVLTEAMYSNDKRCGECTEYYSDGHVRSVCRYDHDEKNGPAREMDGTGGMLFKGTYANGVRTGKGCEFLGPLLCKCGIYENGVLMNWKWCYMLTVRMPMEMEGADPLYPDSYYMQEPLDLFAKDRINLFDCTKSGNNGADVRGAVGNAGNDDKNANNYFLCGRSARA